MIAHPILRSEIQDMPPDAREVLSLRSEGLIGADIARGILNAMKGHF